QPPPPVLYPLSLHDALPIWLGTRFLPVTKTVPKEMLPLVDVPILDVVVSEAVAAGASEVVIVSAPGKASLDEYFAPNPRLEKRRSEEHTSELQSLAYLVCRL